MAKIIGAPTLDDALAALRVCVGENEARGEKSLIFCEDKLTLLAERAVLSELKGTFLSEVTTFARYLSGPKVLSKQGSVMEIAALTEEYRDKLLCFNGRAAKTVYETIAQLSASKVDAEILRAGAEETGGTLKVKLLDLAFLLEKYDERLREKGMLDESGYLALLPEKIASGELKSTHVIFFGFSSFTKQAQAGVRAAFSNALSVTGIFTAGREEFYTNECARIFRKLCEEEGVAEPSMRKCSLEGEALLLQRGLFSAEKFSQPPLVAEKIRRFTAVDEQEEFSLVAALIKKYIAEGMRYRDIAVLVPGKESFLPVEKAFNAYKIPFFADKKRAFSEHPFSKFVLSVLSATADGVLPDEADEIASSVYFGNGDLYRNYLLKFGGYRGAVRREIKDGEAIKGYDREQLTACREKMLGILALFPRKGKGGVYVAAVRALWELVNGEELTEGLQEYFTGAEREFLDISPLSGVLGEIETIAGERIFTAREFFETLKSGLEALELAMIPQSADSVFVGDITDSKFERVPVLFATGLTEELPRTSPDTAVITDGEMEKLKTLKVEIEPAIAQINARARESLALNLCAFTDALYLSYPLKKGGADAERGEVLEYAERLFEMPAMPDLFPYDCCEEEPAALKLLALKNGFESGRENDGKAYGALYEALKTQYGERYTERLLSGGKKEKVFSTVVGSGNTASPTMLERYFECPYAGFVSRVLKLREREERGVLDTDTGTFVHAVLEECAKKFNEFETESECREYARGVGKTLLTTPRFSALSDTGAGEYTAKRLVAEGEEVAAAAYRQLALSNFRVHETEGKISLPELSLFGKTDRIDVSDDYVRVIDYKTGLFDDSAAAYYTGRKLQLELYLPAASKGKRAAGAFYFPAADLFTKADEAKYRMSGFYSGEDEVLRRMDKTLEEGKKSAFFDGKRDGKYTDKGMRQDDFEAFLDYGILVSQRAENEMEAGNVEPSPYEGACEYCKLKSLCGFVGSPRKESGVKCADVVKIVRRERGEE